MGAHVTEGLGAGSKPDIGAAAAEEAMADIKAHLAGCHMTFITAGMGGGTGTGAAPVIARASREDLVAYKLSSNENPHPPLPSVLEAIAAAAATSHRYPDPAATPLVQAIASRFDVPVEHVAVGTGSVAVCGHLVASTCGPGDEVLYAWRSFEAYPIWTQISGATSVQVPLTGSEEHDLEAMAAALTDRTRLVFVCSPNNPTGTVVRHAALERFLDAVPRARAGGGRRGYREFN
jgi:histidinol-phosphate aminotransferase